MKCLKNAKMSPYFEDPTLNILTYCIEYEKIHALGAKTAICLGLGESGTYSSWVDLISMWEATDKNNKRALLKI